MRPKYALRDSPNTSADDSYPSSWARTTGVQSAPQPGPPIVRDVQPQPQSEIHHLAATLPPGRPGNDIPAWREAPLNMAFPPDDSAVALLLQAARQADGEAMSRVLVTNPHINVKDISGRTALHLAAIENDVTAVQRLILRHAGCDTADSGGVTPLMDAAQRGSYPMVQTLVDASAKIKQTDSSGRSTLSHAAESGNVDCIKLLLKRSKLALSDKDGRTPLHHAAMHGKKQAVLYLLDANADINAEDRKGDTPLLLAASRNHLEVVEALLSVGNCKPMTRNKSGCNVYVEACDTINLPLLDLLQKHRVRIEHYESNLLLAEAALVGAGEVMVRLQAQGAVLPDVQQTLFAAIEAGHDSVVDAVLTCFKANPNMEDKKACTPLQHAVMLGNHGAAGLLIFFGATIEHPCHTQPLLCLAVEAGHAAVVDVLLQQKPVAVNMVNAALKTPLMLAAEKGHVRLAEQLCDAGFSVNLAPPKMALPIELAAQGGHIAMLELLHKNGATYPDSLLKDAVSRGQVAVVEQLLETGADPAKAGIDTMSGLTAPAMMDLIMHASGLAGDKQAGFRLDAELRARPLTFVPLLTAMMDNTPTQLATWLKAQDIRSVLWAPIAAMSKTMQEMRDADCLGSTQDQRQILQVVCAALLSKQVYSDIRLMYRNAGLSEIATETLADTAERQVAALRTAAGLWLEQDCLSHIAEFTERCLVHTSLTFVASETLSTYWTTTIGLLPPVAQRLAVCWRRALEQVVTHAKFNGPLSQFQSDLAAKLTVAFSAQFRSLQSDGAFYASASANAPEAYHALVVEQLDWVQQACDASTPLATTAASIGATNANTSARREVDE